jgi:hypothetical protein
VDASVSTVQGGRSVLERSPLHRLPDRVLQWGLSALAAGVLVLIAYFFIRLIGQSSTAFGHVGFVNFFVRNNWDVSQLQDGAACATAGNAGCTFGAWALLLGTVITSAIALVIGVPVAIATALFVTELCPRRFRGALAIGGAVGRLRPVGRVCADPGPEGFPAVSRRHVLVPAVRRRNCGGAELLHRRADPRDHDPADRVGDRSGSDLDGAF